MSAAGVAAWASLGSERYVRVCPDHRFEVVQFGGSTLTCPQGHDVEIWIVLDTRTNKVMGASHYLRGGLVLSPFLKEQEAHADRRACPRGHIGGTEPRYDNGGELCRICRRDDHQRWLHNKRERERQQGKARARRAVA